jgi:hypothetical protein
MDWRDQWEQTAHELGGKGRQSPNQVVAVIPDKNWHVTITSVVGKGVHFTDIKVPYIQSNEFHCNITPCSFYDFAKQLFGWTKLPTVGSSPSAVMGTSNNQQILEQFSQAPEFRNFISTYSGAQLRLFTDSFTFGLSGRMPQGTYMFSVLLPRLIREPAGQRKLHELVCALLHSLERLGTIAAMSTNVFWLQAELLSRSDWENEFNRSER